MPRRFGDRRRRAGRGRSLGRSPAHARHARCPCSSRRRPSVAVLDDPASASEPALTDQEEVVSQLAEMKAIGLSDGR